MSLDQALDRPAEEYSSLDSEIESRLNARIDRRLSEIEQAVAAQIAAATRSIPGVEEPPPAPTPAGAESNEYFAAGRLRRGIGYGLQIGVLVGVLAIVGCELLVRLPEVADKPPRSDAELYFYLALLGVQAVVSVAIVFAALRVFRASERMSIPHWWEPERARLALGEGRRTPAVMINIGMPGWPGRRARAPESDNAATSAGSGT